jgi:hypothetical protein
MKLGLAAAFLLWAGRAEAQDPRMTDRLGPGVLQAVQLQIDSANQDHLPAEPLIRKALEGQSKRADSARIVGAVRAVRLALAGARTALGGGSEEEVIAGANAIRAGVPAEALLRLRRARPASLSTPIDVMTDLVARGVRPSDASSAVERLVRIGRNDRELIRLREQIDQDIRSGLDPRAALERRLAGVPAAGPPIPP